jgi:hypothetical protein
VPVGVRLGGRDLSGVLDTFATGLVPIVIEIVMNALIRPNAV